MGLDLTLLPFNSNSPTSDFSQTVLPCFSRKNLFGQIAKLSNQRDVPETFNSYLSGGSDGERCFGLTLNTAYGEPLKCVKAGDLAALWVHHDVQDNSINKAVWAYLAELPEDTNVALYWN